jgi:hypothetical protein
LSKHERAVSQVHYNLVSGGLLQGAQNTGQDPVDLSVHDQTEVPA